MPARRPNGPKSLPTKPINQRISLARAVDFTKRYQRSAPASEKAGFFFARGLKDLLAQDGVYGLRIYHGLDADGRYRAVLVAVDAKGEDITSASAALASARGTQDAVLLDGHFPCPPFCPRDSPLA